MELDADEPRMILVFDDFRQDAIRRHAREVHAPLLKPPLVGSIDLVTMAVPLRNFCGAIDLRYPTAPREYRIVSTEPHGATEISARTALLQLIAFQPLGHETDHRLRCRAELSGIGVFDAAQIARGLQHRHLHPETNTEIRDMALACELRRFDLAFRTTLAESSGNEDAVYVLEKWRRIFVLEHFRLDPIEIDLYLVSNAAVRECFDQ